MSIIKTKHLSYHYIRHDEEGNVEGEVPAVKDVNLSVEPGEFIAILGHNGSGKSTLAKHFNALLLPSEGCIVVDGMDTARPSTAEMLPSMNLLRPPRKPCRKPFNMPTR